MHKHLGYLVARCFDGYGYLGNQWIRARYGIPRRRATVSKDATLLSPEDLAHPEHFLTRFSRRTEEGFDGFIYGSDPRRVSFSFASPYDSGIARNDRVYATLYQGAPRNSRVIILVGGLFSSATSYTRMAARRFAKGLFDCCEITLPFHGARMAYGTAGVEWISADPIVTFESFVQSVCDVNRLHDILSSRFRYENIFAAGMSVGGNLACVSSLVKEYGGISLFMAGISPAEIFWHSPSPYLRGLRRRAEEAGYTLEDVQRHWTISDISRFDARPRSRKFLMMNGEFDTVTKPRYAHRLMNTLPGCVMISCPAGHYSAACFSRAWVKESSGFFLM